MNAYLLAIFKYFSIYSKRPSLLQLRRTVCEEREAQAPSRLREPAVSAVTVQRLRGRRSPGRAQTALSLCFCRAETGLMLPSVSKLAESAQKVAEDHTQFHSDVKIRDTWIPMQDSRRRER